MQPPILRTPYLYGFCFCSGLGCPDGPRGRGAGVRTRCPLFHPTLSSSPLFSQRLPLSATSLHKDTGYLCTRAPEPGGFDSASMITSLKPQLLRTCSCEFPCDLPPSPYLCHITSSVHSRQPQVCLELHILLLLPMPPAPSSSSSGSSLASVHVDLYRCAAAERAGSAARNPFAYHAPGACRFPLLRTALARNTTISTH